MGTVLSELVDDYRSTVICPFFPDEPEKEFQFLFRIKGFDKVYFALESVWGATGPIEAAILIELQDIFNESIEY